MYLRDDTNKFVNAEFSLSWLDSEFCVVVESSGGSNPKQGTKRRNPDYNNLLNLIFSRLRDAKVKITRVVLDSEKVSTIPVNERVVDLGCSGPIDLAAVNIDEFRKRLGQKIATMHREPSATKRGNAQKRIRICLESRIYPEQLVSSVGNPSSRNEVPDWPEETTETEREYLRTARRGQGKFRDALLTRYHQQCPVTGIANQNLLIASHIKPWNVCSNIERLDPDNGILLSAMVDRLFDKGLITFDDEGNVLISPRLSSNDKIRCGLETVTSIDDLSDGNKRYLVFHRKVEYKST